MIDFQCLLHLIDSLSVQTQPLITIYGLNDCYDLRVNEHIIRLSRGSNFHLYQMLCKELPPLGDHFISIRSIEFCVTIKLGLIFCSMATIKRNRQWKCFPVDFLESISRADRIRSEVYIPKTTKAGLLLTKLSLY